MAEEKTEEKLYPVKTLHDFLFELDKEWSRFRRGSVLGLISSGILFLLVIWLILSTRHFKLGLIDFGLFIGAAVIAGYSIYSIYQQYRFLNKWERRLGLLLHLEDQMLSEKLDASKP